MRTRDKLIIALIVILTMLSLMTLFWDSFGEGMNRDKIRLGLDLEGGAHLVYEADFSELPEDQDQSDAMSGVISVIEKRIDAYGVSEPVIQKMGEDRILVQLPGIDDIEEAKALIGATVLIKFREFVPFDPSASGSPNELIQNGSPVQPAEDDTVGYFAFLPNDDGQMELVEVPRSEAQYRAIPAMGEINGEKVELTSHYFKGNVEFRIPSNNRPTIYFQWNETGGELFWQITSRLATYPEDSVERRLGIFVGDNYESSPHVEEPIRDDGVITGMSQGEAKRLTRLLNAGRIDVPLHTIEEHDVSATLGADFVDWSKQAGISGLILVILFLIFYYRLPGALAGIALLIYVALVMSAFQLIPVTLTLAGIAGFILSIGMAVDANILIFERMKEEIRMGRTTRAAVEVGFSRAWPAIRDSNFSTFITCGILYWMGSYLAVPAVQGFALTLFVGVAISMFSAIVITRTFLRLICTTPLVEQRTLFISSTRGIKFTGEGR